MRIKLIKTLAFYLFAFSLTGITAAKNLPPHLSPSKPKQKIQSSKGNKETAVIPKPDSLKLDSLAMVTNSTNTDLNPSFIEEGKNIPDIQFVNMDGDTLKLSSFHGKKVLVQFWSTHCEACLDAMKEMKEFYQAFSAKNWQVISLTSDVDLPEVQQAVMKYHMDWMVGMAGPDLKKYYETRRLPVNFKINPEGVLEQKNVSLTRRGF